MIKPLLVSLGLLTGCATNEKPAALEKGSMPTNSQPEAPASVTHALSKDGTKIAFEKVGKGPALIIVGGALSHRAGGKTLASKLMDHFTVYTYDRRGRGDSTDTQPYAVAREIEDLAALIEKAGGQAHVYGVSSGGVLALHSAAELGAAKVTKLALYEPPLGQAERDFNEQKAGVAQRVKEGKPGDAATFFLTAIGMPPPALEEMKRSPEWEITKKIDFTLTYDYAVLGDGNVPDTVKQIAVPTLVMDGQKTLPFMRPAADRLAQLIPNARRKTLEGQSHQADPEVVARLLREFFAPGT